MYAELDRHAPRSRYQLASGRVTVRPRFVHLSSTFKPPYKDLISFMPFFNSRFNLRIKVHGNYTLVRTVL